MSARSPPSSVTLERESACEASAKPRRQPSQRRVSGGNARPVRDATRARCRPTGASICRRTERWRRWRRSRRPARPRFARTVDPSLRLDSAKGATARRARASGPTKPPPRSSTGSIAWSGSTASTVIAPRSSIRSGASGRPGRARSAAQRPLRAELDATVVGAPWPPPPHRARDDRAPAQHLLPLDRRPVHAHRRPDVRDWLPSGWKATATQSPDAASRLRILRRLTDAEMFEEFLQSKYLGAKSFSLEGAESLIPLLDLAIEKAGGQGVDEIVIGMAHRGRLNVLANILGKPPREIFREFEDRDPELLSRPRRREVPPRLQQRLDDRGRRSGPPLAVLQPEPPRVRQPGRARPRARQAGPRRRPRARSAAWRC